MSRIPSSVITSLAVAAIAAIAAGACKKSERSSAQAKPEEAAAPAPAAPRPAPTAPTAPTAPPPGGVNAALLVPATSRGFTVAGATVAVVDAGLTPAALKEERGVEAFTEEKKLADGWLVRFAEGDTPVTVVSRTVGGLALVCDDGQAAPEDRAAALAVCTGLRAGPGGLVVPVAVPTTVEAGPLMFVSDLAVLTLSPSSEDAPADVAAATATAKGLTVIEQHPATGGFAVAYQAWNGGIEAQGLMYEAIARVRLGALDVTCEGGGLKSSEQAVAAMGLCASLRAP